jgi:hypothetical protein
MSIFYSDLALIQVSLVRAREALCQCLPEALRDQSFSSVLRNEEAVQRWLALLTKNITTASPAVDPSFSDGNAPQDSNGVIRAGFSQQIPSFPAKPLAPSSLGTNSAWNVNK